MRWLSGGAVMISVVLLASCATPLPRLVQERPMSGAKAAEPMPDAKAHITNRTGKSHLGTDFTSYKKAIPIYVVKEGVVVSNTAAASNSKANTITVNNSDGSVSRYLHVASAVRPGTGLSIGEAFAVVLLPGQPGYGETNTGPHLHYEQFASEPKFAARQSMTTDEVVAQWSD